MTELPRRGAATLGDGKKDGSNFIVATGERLVFDFMMETQVQWAQMNGHQVTPELLQQFAEYAQKRSDETDAQIRARGVSVELRKLLGAKRKKDALHLAHSMTVTLQQLVELAKNSGDIGFSHHAKHLAHVPEGRELTAADYADLAANGSSAECAVRRVDQLYEERTHRSVHLFANGSDQWHLFFMTFRDTSGSPSTGAHHWSAGSHVHYTSYLITNMTKERVWDSLDWQKHSVQSVHIRYREPDDGRGKQRIVAHPSGKTVSRL